jgi:ribonuclease HII
MAKITEDLLQYEKELYKQGYKLIAGCDEAGRGPLCGPVVAAAVILPINYHLEGLTDSKKLTEKERNKFFVIIKKDSIAYGISIIDNKKIDEINILEASRLGMVKAINMMKIKPDYILTDAMKLPKENVLPIIKGDAKSITIAAASVLAKVTRDRIMYEYDKIYPEYEFCKHKGYPTKLHLENLKKYGILDIYRLTYKPVSKIWSETNEKNQQKQNV